MTITIKATTLTELPQSESKSGKERDTTYDELITAMAGTDARPVYSLGKPDKDELSKVLSALRRTIRHLYGPKDLSVIARKSSKGDTLIQAAPAIKRPRKPTEATDKAAGQVVDAAVAS